MRPEHQVLAQLRDWADGTDGVRAIVLTSSRADPKRTPDPLSDYDVQVYVRDTRPFIASDAWLEPFGSIMVRWPTRPRPTADDDWVTQLVLFDDGVRIDFQITATEPRASDDLDNGYRVVVDGDGLTEALPPPTHASYLVTRPTAEAFDDRLNAFWWDIVYVAKALWRGELNYAKSMHEGTIRFDKLLPLIEWDVGVQHGWAVTVGLHGRWLHRHLDDATWERYLRTFAGADPEENWDALFATLDFVGVVGRRVAEALGFDYPDEVDAKVSRYIRAIKDLPRG